MHRLLAPSVAIAMSLTTLMAAPASALPSAPVVAAKYKSCTYPKSTGSSKPKVNARSWKQQGFSGQVRGIDVSRWQHPKSARYPKGKPINFYRIRTSSSVSFVIVKASDGRAADKGQNAYWYRKDRLAAKRQGMIVGAYHYAVPGQMGSGEMYVPKAAASDAARQSAAAANRRADAKKQAAFAAKSALNAPSGDLPLTLDMEEKPCGWSWIQVAQWTKDFLGEAQRITGRTPIVYMNGYMVGKMNAAALPGFDLSQYHLWVAMWGPKIGPVPRSVPIWGTSWKFWQFTSDGKVAGVPSARTDLDVFSGSLSALQALAGS